MVSDKFRRQLRQEASQWQTDGLITTIQHQQLAERYEFARLETAARDRFVIILVGLGSILLGLGAITFVAANWQALSRELKVGLLLALFGGVNTAGFYLWKHPLGQMAGQERWQRRLGQGLLLLGGLLLGANMALMGQIFHRGGSAYELCLVWGLGVLAMAYSLRLTSLGVLSLLLMGMGYWLGMQELTGVGAQPGLNELMQYMPIVAGVLFIPLAYWCRSRVIFGMGAIAIISSFEVGLADVGRLFLYPPGIGMAIAFTLPPALLWGYDDRLWGRLFRQPHSSQPFRPLARGLAICWLAVLIYGLSFHWLWSGTALITRTSLPPQALLSASLPFLPNLIGLAGWTLVEWFELFRSGTSARSRWRLDLTSGSIFCFLVITAVVTRWHWSVMPIVANATFIFNVLLFLIAAGLVREGLALGQRRLFWFGLVLLVVQIMSRMLEYETGLLLKSLVFLLCGVGVIFIGLWFERYIHTLNPNPLLLASPTEEELS